MIALATKVTTVARWLWAPTRRKWVLAALTVVVVLASLLLARYWSGKAHDAEIEAEVANRGVTVLVEARDADNTALVNREGSRKAILDEERHDRVQTEDALRRHQEWANEPVPADVLGSLRD